MSVPPISRRLLLGGALTGATGAAVGGMLGPSAAMAAAVAWKVFFVEHPGGTPDQTAIQAALSEAASAGGGHVVVGRGTWNLVSPLLIRANTRLTLTPATVIRRTGAVNAMLRNGTSADTTTTGYNGPGNILVEGGVWNANAAAVSTPGWAMVFAHTQNITVRDVEIRDVAEYHAIELNSTYNALVENCSLIGAKDRASAAWNQEAISMDLAAPGLVPWGAADNTHCRQIRIVNNRCQDWPTFAGTHTGFATAGHEEFIISGNNMRNLRYWGVSLRNTSRAVIAGNTMASVGGGVWIRCHDDGTTRRPPTSIVIAENVIDGTNVDEGVRLAGTTLGSIGDGGIYCTSITDNVIRRAARSGIKVEWAPEVRVSDNSVYVAGANGIEAISCEAAMLASNYLRDTQREGIVVTGGASQQVTANSVVNACRATDAARDAVSLVGVSKASVQANKITSVAPQPRYALAADATSSGIFYTNNDVRDGYQTAAFNMAGSGHVSLAGNVT